MTGPNLEFLEAGGDVEQAYRLLLRLGGADHDALARHLGLSPDAAAARGSRVVGLGLATAQDGVLRPVPPGKAVERLVERRLARSRDALEAEVARCGIVDSLHDERAAGLAEASRVGRDGPPVQRLESLDDIQAALDEMTFFTRTENLTAQPRGVLSPHHISHSRPLDMRVLRRGVAMRSLLGRDALGDPGTMAYLWELADKGCEVRIARQPVERMIVCDRAVALTSLDPEDGSKGALLTREPGLVATLVKLYEQMWEAADPLPAPSGATQSPGARPEGVERQVLDALRTADKDEAGARDLGISVRTYRKHVASLMQRLDATNRFQVALLARERGWI
ncbi:transcriptional regulator [Streptomyces spiroverticillatus]|uniref:Transcriptional regulator n=1 Tax=Streptomyces finlayi TaxID=67296 RepID=A0A918WUH7_9ACTN|nr:response regulator transcription factor [Streptomyces finlayi]GGZ97600.1 transcriptional regulator [Streptomyces spiroverticillatus]GHC82692.1 transcriptional regulator [Streptomyces finlayi]